MQKLSAKNILTKVMAKIDTFVAQVRAAFEMPELAMA